MSKVDLDSPAFFASPTEALDRLRRDAPVYFHAPWDAHVLTRYEDVVRVVRDPEFSVDRGGAIARSSAPEVASALEDANRFFASFMVFADPPKHTRLRRVLASAFTPARMREWTHAIDTLLEQSLAALVARDEPFDLVAELSGPMPARMTGFILGLRAGDEALLHRLTDDFFALFGSTDAPPSAVLAAHRSVEVAKSYFDGVLGERERNPGTDLLSHVVESERREPTLDRDELVALAMTIVAGAYGTTTHLIGHAVLAALDDRALFRALGTSPELAAAVVEETLRIDGPALAVVRRATKDAVISGVPIPENGRLYCMLHAANHDPAVFPNPGRFDPSRSPNRHLGLGAGAHFCLGASLTRLEATRALMAISRAMPDLELASTPVRAGNLSMRGLTRLVVSPRARTEHLPRSHASNPDSTTDAPR